MLIRAGVDIKVEIKGLSIQFWFALMHLNC